MQYEAISSGCLQATLLLLLEYAHAFHRSGDINIFVDHIGYLCSFSGSSKLEIQSARTRARVCVDLLVHACTCVRATRAGMQVHHRGTTSVAASQKIMGDTATSPLKHSSGGRAVLTTM